MNRQANRLRNAQELTEALALSADSAELSADSHGQALESLRRVARLDPDLSELVEAAERLAEEQSDLTRRIRLAGESVQDDPETRELVEARLTLLGELRRKYGHDLDEVLAFGKEAARREAEIEKLLSQAESVESDLSPGGNRTSQLCRLTWWGSVPRPPKPLPPTHSIICASLVSRDPSLLFSVEEDEVRLNFASDSRLTPGPVERVASGGELSRLVLSLRLAASRAEIGDSGFRRDRHRHRRRHRPRDGTQTGPPRPRPPGPLCHPSAPGGGLRPAPLSPESAGVETSLEEVSGEERTAELARMLAGLPDSERGRQAASELLELAVGRE